MNGQEYLENIFMNLESGRKQHRMGQNVLRAFGYSRRRTTAIDDINATLDRVGLISVPFITTAMPLKVPLIRFELKSQNEGFESTETVSEPEVSGPEDDDTVLQAEEDSEGGLPEPAFKVSDLASAETDVKCVSSSESIEYAYTITRVNKFSQLVVADGNKPMEQAIKGIVSFQSMTKALMNGNAKTVSDCIDSEVPILSIDADLSEVMNRLSSSDVVLVIGKNKRLQGIVTAWDLAEEFALLVDPFERIGEIEERLRTLVAKKLGREKATEFLTKREPPEKKTVAEIEEMTLGELQSVIGYSQHWDEFALQFDRTVFLGALNDAREFRNRLMHFGDPLDATEMIQLSNFCELVRDIQLE